MAEGGTGSEHLRSTYICGCSFSGPEVRRHPTVCPVHHSIWFDTQEVASGHDGQTEDLARAHDLIGTLHLYITRHTETQLTTEQKELLYDIVEARYRAHGISDEPMERWWR